MQSIMFPASDSITLPQDVRSGWDAKPSLCRVKDPWLKPFSHSECGIFLFDIFECATDVTFI